MKHFHAAVVATLMAGGLLVSTTALANGALTVTLADYNSAQVGANSNVIRVPEGDTINSVYYEAVYSIAPSTKLEANSLLTITLPTGFTFFTNPQLYFIQYGGSGGVDATLHAGGVGFQTATFQITADASPGGVFIYPSFEVQTPAAFSSAFGGNPYPLSVQATGNANPNNNDASPVSQPAFTHAVGSLPNTITPGGGLINLAFPFHGNQFVAGGNDGKTIQGAGSVATFDIITETHDPFNGNVNVLTAAGGLNSLAPGDTANVLVEGYFNGIASAYATTSAAACQTTVPAGSTVGTITPTSLSFSGLLINTPVQICIIPNGVMWADTQPYVYEYSAGAGVTDFFGGLAQTTANNFFTYSTTPTVTILQGTPQRAPINTSYATPLKVKVTDPADGNSPLTGIDVVFTSPYYYSNSPSGTVSGGVGTDSSGVATVSGSANSVICSYPVRAQVGGAQVLFVLTNEPDASDDILFCYDFDE